MTHLTAITSSVSCNWWCVVFCLLLLLLTKVLQFSDVGKVILFELLFLNLSSMQSLDFDLTVPRWYIYYIFLCIFTCVLVFCYMRLKFMENPPDNLRENLLVQSRIYRSINNGKTSWTWWNKAALNACYPSKHNILVQCLPYGAFLKSESKCKNEVNVRVACRCSEITMEIFMTSFCYALGVILVKKKSNNGPLLYICLTVGWWRLLGNESG